MKKSKYPRLRSVTRRGRGGQVWVYFRYDMRAEGKPDVQLGKDYDAALKKWERLHHNQPLVIGTVQEAVDQWRVRELVKYQNTDTRRSYEKQLKKIENVFGKARWDEISLPALRHYLDRRTAKIQGNRELAVFSIVWGKARVWGMTDLQWPAAGVKGWKNPERARQLEVTDEVFAAIYHHADRVLRDSMDIASSTGMRVTDVRTIRLPVDGVLRFKASKTARWAEFQVSQSPVLSALVARRLSMKAQSVMLLTSDTGRQVSERMLSDRWESARAAAAKANPSIANEILAMFNRDLRKRAADLAVNLEAASKLLQHSSLKLTQTHYRTKPQKLDAVR
jgi:hypothetical protein